MTSGAFAPPQPLNEGIIIIQVIEGQLEKVEIRGLSRLQENYVRSRFPKTSDKPLNINQLDESLRILQFNPLFEQVRAELKRGTAPQLSYLVVDFKEAPAFGISLQFDNYESPSIGEYKGTIAIEHQNLLGWGDRLEGSYGLTEGLDKYDISYTVPFNAKNGTIKLEYFNGDSEITEQFEELDLRAESETFSLQVRQPLMLTPNNEFALFLGLDLRESQTFILEDIPFSFTLGPEEGESRVTALRLGQEWINRSTNRVLAWRSQFSFGLDLFNATTNSSGIDGKFFSWQGQFQWIERVDEDITFLLRVAAQLSPNTLLPIEQFDVGGIDTVRGYRRNLRFGDSGVATSAEMRFALVRDNDWGSLEVAPFFDLGTVWSNNDDFPTPDPSTIASLGVGLRWQIDDAFFVRLDYGVPLVDVEEQGDSLQESGFSFSVGGKLKF
ncbi:MAG: ShlB/FhaC/HecB family hemolysin secretion/activation protein [Hydrococcus sp. RM1_1_31]|nr:ShlB/FhaC/HecB family hemolysin secretion/activation protein [Hydrococcus sp. RM1_1_31]